MTPERLSTAECPLSVARELDFTATHQRMATLVCGRFCAQEAHAIGYSPDGAFLPTQPCQTEICEQELRMVSDGQTA